jgi:hypothetical protein
MCKAFMPPRFVVLVILVRLFWVESVGRKRREVHRSTEL